MMGIIRCLGCPSWQVIGNIQNQNKMKQIIVQSLISSTQTAVMQDNKLIELLIEDNIHKKTKSNIYRGIVKNIKPGIEAAFVDIGFEKMAYLPIKSSDDIKNGMEVLVQINKEAVGTKAPRLTQEISLSGRYLVLIPSNGRITISNKISEEKGIPLRNIG